MIIVEQTLLHKQNGLYQKHSVYRNVVNYCSLEGDHFVSIVNQNVCLGPSRIKIDSNLDFKENQEKFPKYLNFTEILLKIPEQNRLLWCLPKTNNVIKKDSLQEILYELEIICETEKGRLFPLDGINVCMFEIIEKAFFNFEQEEKVFHLSKIIGMGPGLTPLGDDILCGLLLCRNFLEYDVKWNEKVKKYAKNHTTSFSYRFIENACQKEYSEDLYSFACQVFKEGKVREESVEEILSFGSSSGFGILYGFTKYLSIYVNRMEKL